MSDNLRVARVRLDDIRFHPHNIRRDLGDLRGLTDSIRRFGIMQPVVVEDYGDGLRLRAGHRRCAAARLAGLDRVPAVIHPEPLDDDEWLMAAMHENTFRRGLHEAERRETLLRLRELGCTWVGIASSLCVSVNTVQRWASDASRANKARPKVNASRLRTFVTEWRARPEATAADVLDALAALTEAPVRPQAVAA